MLTGDLRNQADGVWNTLVGGITNLLTVIEQPIYLLFIRRPVHEVQVCWMEAAVQNPVFGSDQQELRWSRFKELDADTTFWKEPRGSSVYEAGRRGGCGVRGAHEGCRLRETFWGEEAVIG